MQLLDTYSEQYRHQCEVRHILKLRVEYGSPYVHDCLEKVAKRRGKTAAARLTEDAARQWGLGNRGEDRDWRA